MPEVTQLSLDRVIWIDIPHFPFRYWLGMIHCGGGGGVLLTSPVATLQFKYLFPVLVHT